MKNFVVRANRTEGHARSGWLPVLLALLAGIIIGAGTVYRLRQDYRIPGYLSSKNEAATTSLAPLWRAWNLIDTEFAFDHPQSKEQVEWAIKGVVAGLKDPYSEYYTAEESKEFFEQLEGQFAGIGAELTERDQHVEVVRVLSNMPAEKGGLLAQDIILAVNGESALGKPVDAVVKLIRGDAGTAVTLKVLRSEVEKEIVLTRQVIEVPNVTWKRLPEASDTLYIDVRRFSEDVVRDVKEALEAGEAASRPRAIILDLRGNLGGHLEGAVQMLGLFVPPQPSATEDWKKDRVAVRSRDKNKKEELARMIEPVVDGTTPLYVLVNRYSASASEIVAGTLRDYERATLIGEKTFGKGTVQATFGIDSALSGKKGSGGTLKLTIAEWFTAAGVGIHKTGITPDISLTISETEVQSSSDSVVQAALQASRE